MWFRDAGAEDVDAIVALVESAYRGDASRGGWTTEADLLEGQRTDGAAVADLVAAGAVVLAESDDGALLGCCELRPTGYFGMFAVSPAGQGTGTGSALLAEAARRTRAAGGAALEMTVLKQREDLIAFYVRRGFEATDEERPFPYGDERFGVPKRDDLVFVVLRKAI